MMNFLRVYFLRIYAMERLRGKRDPAVWLREALFQTRYLAVMPFTGLASAAVVIAGRLSGSAWAVLTEYRPVIMVAGVLGVGFCSFMVVKRALTQIHDLPAQADAHSSARDRRMQHVQFWCTLLLSLALPFAVGALLPMPAHVRSDP